MRFIYPAAICSLAMFIGVLALITRIEQPVGHVSDVFCKRAEKPCYTFEYEVNK